MSEPVTFDDCEAIRETDRALLVRIPDLDDQEVWIPKSQIHDDSEVYALGHVGALVLPGWLARKKEEELL